METVEGGRVYCNESLEFTDYSTKDEIVNTEEYIQDKYIELKIKNLLH